MNYDTWKSTDLTDLDPREDDSLARERDIFDQQCEQLLVAIRRACQLEYEESWAGMCAQFCYRRARILGLYPPMRVLVSDVAQRGAA